jgi:hypothetical protein
VKKWVAGRQTRQWDALAARLNKTSDQNIERRINYETLYPFQVRQKVIHADRTIGGHHHYRHGQRQRVDAFVAVRPGWRL